MKITISNRIHGIFPYLMMLIVTMMTVSVSCSRKKTKELIPEKTFMKIYNEIALTNSLFEDFTIRNRYNNKDSIELYMDIFNSYGYSSVDFEKTLHFYYTKKPKRLINLIDKAIGETEKMELLLTQRTEAMPKIQSFWNNATSIFLPDPKSYCRCFFTVSIINPGTYSLNYSITVDPSDKTVDPHLSVWYVCADSLDNGTKTCLPPVYYHKDGSRYDFKVPIIIKDRKRRVLSGNIYSYKGIAEEGDRRGCINDISITYKP